MVLGTLKRIKFENSKDLYSFYKEQIDEEKIKIIKWGKNILEYIIINSYNVTINSLH